MRGYFVRITPDDATMSLQHMVEVIDWHLEATQYVVSHEVASRVHFHILLYVPFSAERLRYRIKQHIEGQVYISGKDIQDKVRCIAYTIKDGVYHQKGIRLDEWLKAKQTTHKKITFDDALKVVAQNYRTGRNAEKLVSELVQLYIDFNRKIYKQHIKAHYDTIRVSVDTHYRNRIEKEILGFD